MIATGTGPVPVTDARRLPINDREKGKAGPSEMEIVGLTAAQFRDVVETVSHGQYGGNLRTLDVRDVGGVRRPRTRGRVGVLDSRSPGARTSWSGRHGPWASWHAYRDVLIELFHRYPDAIVRTAIATYKGREGFEAEYPGTAYRNVGSMIEPVTMPELSVGPDPEPWRPPGATHSVPEPGYVYWSGAGGSSPDTSQPYILDRIDKVLSDVGSDA